jgi:hypothetical protein
VRHLSRRHVVRPEVREPWLVVVEHDDVRMMPAAASRRRLARERGVFGGKKRSMIFHRLLR